MNKFLIWIILGAISIYILIIGYVYYNQHNIDLSPSSDYHPPPKSFNITQNFIQFGNNDSLHTWHINNNKTVGIKCPLSSVTNVNSKGRPINNGSGGE